MGNGSSQNDNLDLTNVASSDHDELINKIEGFYKADGAVKTQLAWHWERNHLFLDGKQWLVYEGSRDTGGTWKPLKVSAANEYIPRPVTNLLYDNYQTLKSYLLKTKPRSTVRPNSENHSDKVAAKLANLVLECNYERLREAANYEYAAACAITYGTVFKKDFWDTSSVQTARVPLTQIIETPMGPLEQEVIDPETGDVMTEEVPIGDVNTEVVEPYRIAIDPLSTTCQDARWIMEYSIQPLNWIKETYGKSGDGYTGKANEVKPEPGLSGTLRRFFQLKTSSGVKGTTAPVSGSGGSDTMVENCAVVKEYYERPSKDHPKGRLIVVANSVLLYSGDSPCEGPDIGDWHPYSDFRWEVVPGRFWGKSPLDDGVEIQKRINSIDAVIILTRKTQAIPQKLIPKGVGVHPGQWTGRPGLEVFWRDNGTGSRPETIPAAGVDSQVFIERDKMVEDLKNVTGAIDILKGDRPPGVTAASALNMLYEVGTGKLFPALNRWKEFIETSQKKQLRLVSKHYQEPREDFIKMLRSKNKDLSSSALENFIGKDLHDNCNVIIEAGSNIPKLQAAEQARLIELAQIGTLGLEDPINQREFNERLGVLGFDNQVGPDLKRAQWENELLDQANPDQSVLVMTVDNHEIHIGAHEKRMKEPSFMELSPEAQQAYMDHIEEHQEFLALEKQQAQLEAALSGQPPGPGPEDPKPPVSAGKGAGDDLKEAIFDVSTPGDTPQ